LDKIGKTGAVEARVEYLGYLLKKGNKLHFTNGNKAGNAGEV
jgi:hypothetical protein